ncbi:MAG: hypothetical protein IJB90_03975 [Clostridia bacterium]|nr:hypothetical protein [Clostridia bacterium]
MQKLKQNANVVGVNCIRPHFEGITKKNKEKGITLIALIITIIVMLILVGVTINVALNGGLFQKAETATKQTQIEAEKEELLSAVIATIGTDGELVLEDIELPAEWEESNGVYTSPKGNTYTVDKNGKITEGGANSGAGNNTNTQTTIYDVAYTCEYTDKDTGEIINYAYVIRENNKVYTLVFNEDFTGFADKNEAAECIIGNKSNFSSDIMAAYPDLNFETEVREEVVLFDGSLWLVIRIVDNQEILSDGKDDFIRNDTVDISGIDFDSIQ